MGGTQQTQPTSPRRSRQNPPGRPAGNTARPNQREALAEETAAKARAAQAEADVKAAQASGLQQQAAVHRGEAVTLARAPQRAVGPRRHARSGVPLLRHQHGRPRRTATPTAGSASLHPAHLAAAAHPLRSDTNTRPASVSTHPRSGGARCLTDPPPRDTGRPEQHLRAHRPSRVCRQRPASRHHRLPRHPDRSGYRRWQRRSIRSVSGVVNQTWRHHRALGSP